MPRKSKRSYTVFRDDFNTFNRGSYHVDVTAWGGGVCYLMRSHVRLQVNIGTVKVNDPHSILNKIKR